MQAFLSTILIGLITGSVYALASTGVVLTYKTSGILNFGYGALALFTTFVYWQLAGAWGWPVWLAAAVVVLVIAPAIGFALDGGLFRRIRGQPIVIGVIATVGLWVGLQGVVIAVWHGQSKNILDLSLFPSRTIGLPGGVHVGLDQLAVFGLAAAAAAVLAAFLKFTRLGVAFRAVVDNREVAGLMAINTPVVSGMAWALATSFAALAGILLTPRLLLDQNFLPPFIITQVLGAAVVGYLGSIPLAWVGGILLGVSEGLLIKYAHFVRFVGGLQNAMPFLVMMTFVLLAPRHLRRGSGGASFIVRTRQIPAQATPAMRAVVGVGFFAALAVLPGFLGGWKLALTIGMVHAIIFLSLVILTGYSGQISLGHTAFMGIAAFTAGHLVADQGLPVWVAFVLGSLAAVPAGALIGIVAVRVHGLFLALMTLAFAFMAQELFFRTPGVSGGPGGVPVPRPPGATSDTAFFYVVLISMAVCVLVAVNLRSGRTGRILAAMRDSETASRALGINVVKYKAVVFGISALMAGFAGILYTMILQQATSLTFIPFYSLVYLTLAVVGGIFHVGGALVAGLLFGLYPKIFSANPLMLRLEYIFFGLGATLALASNPDGLFGEFRFAGGYLLSLLRRRGGAAQPLPVAGGRE